MKNISRGCSGQYPTFDELGLETGHGDLYCGIHCFPKKYAKMFGIVRGSHAHLPESFTIPLKLILAGMRWNKI
jgi:hypothetical protein